MANFTYAEYTKFIEEITEAANKTFNMKEVANLLYNVHGIKKEIRVVHCYSGNWSPFLNVFLTKEGLFKFVSNFKNEKDGGSMMLPPSEAETVIETLTRSYKK